MAGRKRESETEKIKCQKCAKLKAPTAANFYVNGHQLFNWDKFEVCKDCTNEFIGSKGSNGYINRVYSMLALLDKPFLYDMWKQRDEDWQKYIPVLSSMPQYKGLTFKDSIYEFKNPGATENQNNSEFTTTLTVEEIEELKAFWGRGLSIEELDYLQNEYSKLLNSYECDSYAMELLFQEAAQQRLTIKRLREESKPVDKELKTLQDLLGSANIKPVQETGANATEQATFGTLIKKYENERPIPEPDPIWEDVDGVKKYIMVWFFGHLCRMLGINNEYSQMYDKEIAKHTVDNPTYDSDDEEDYGDFL